MCEYHGWIVMPFQSVRKCQGCRRRLRRICPAAPNDGTVPEKLKDYWITNAMYAWWNETNRLNDIKQLPRLEVKPE